MAEPGDIVCVGNGGVVSWDAFASDIAAFRMTIAEASHVCNLFADRYAFMVGLAATLLNGQVTVLPPSLAECAVKDALHDAPAPILLGDATHGVRAGSEPRAASQARGLASTGDLVERLQRSTGEVHVFTSGSTSRPVRHLKNWRALTGGAKLTAEILQAIGCSPGTCGIIGTTPHQHMYGLEATVFACLAFDYALYTGTVFYPADLEAAVATLKAADAERIVLVTSPTHLKFLEGTILASRDICGIVSATAPLPLALAARLESRGDLPVWEIYGSTETGSLARRRTVKTEEWTPLADFVLEQQAGRCVAAAPHLPQPAPLGDAIELAANGRFRLLGRLGDMVNIAGKRTNLAALNAILTETPGLADGVVVKHQSGSDDVLAVIATLDRGENASQDTARVAIRRQFRLYVDPVFVPKQIVFVNEIRRSRTGKIPSTEIEKLLVETGIS
jgi:acyl-coenzyme A synthetase/AMP-(fatty) acid ligase